MKMLMGKTCHWRQKGLVDERDVSEGGSENYVSVMSVGLVVGTCQ